MTGILVRPILAVPIVLAAILRHRSALFCRESRGVCDAEERCSGTVCPKDELLEATRACRAKADLCDAPELCTGVNFDCGKDLIARKNTLCRVVEGPCDTEDRCDGESIVCADTVLAKGTPCSAPTEESPCTATAHCDGQSGQCPDPVAPDGTLCVIDDPCIVTPACLHGKCHGKFSCECTDDSQCHDGNDCTTDKCVGSCEHTTREQGAPCIGDPRQVDRKCTAEGYCVGRLPTIADATSTMSTTTLMPAPNTTTAVTSLSSSISPMYTPVVLVLLALR
eukprot:TRINITY_DN2573_c0_g1_i1.p1 TRINITY_DN2573_c0_g1~~TRINITY_DN2573_c0_g1_i1.p1  ORF type:complete len:280 (-),score=77.04 TRINITY_DN2573_c0_g1_i1:25-864(-)